MAQAASQRTPSAPREARCGRCGESFVIEDGVSGDLGGGATEMLHPRKRDGALCGGIGVPFRKYVIRNPNR